MSFARHALVVLAAVSFPSTARALDKQGSAHAGEVEGASRGVSVTGNVALGLALYNPTYAARPNNTGLAFLRTAGLLDVDLIGTRLSVPVDVNVFTDQKARPGGRMLVPSEIDFISGVTSTWPVGPGALEGGARVEVDQGSTRAGTRAAANRHVRRPTVTFAFAISCRLPPLRPTLQHTWRTATSAVGSRSGGSP